MTGTKTVLVIGAGATVAQAKPSKPSRTKMPPLDATFFGLCRSAGVSELDSVGDYMEQTYGLDIGEDGVRMEEVFNHIYSDALSQHPPSGCLAAYWALLRMYARVLGDTTNPLKATGRSGVYALVSKLLKDEADQTIAFVTFNQDLMIEKALEALANTKQHKGIPWDIALAYQMAFGATTAVRSVRSNFQSGGGRSYSILKLHGSLNWFYRVRSGTDPANALRSPNKELHCVMAVSIRPTLKFPVKGGGGYKVGIPLIIPPIYEKASRYMATVAPLWDSASGLLQKADRIVVFGYSFPETDFASRALFRRALHMAMSIKELSVIDPNPEIAARIARNVNARAVRYFRDVPAYEPQ